MSHDPVKSCIFARRSIRSFTHASVPRSLLFELIEAGCMAPSGSNLQTWRFLVVDDSDLLWKIAAVSPGIAETPPCIIVICSDLESASKGGVLATEELALMDVCMAAQNIMLLAVERGYGTCAIKSFHSGMLHGLLNLPEHLKPQLLLAIGVARENASIVPFRRPLSDIAFLNEWGNALDDQ